MTAAKREKMTTSVNGEPIRHRADGEKVLAHGHSPVRERHLAATEARQAAHAELTQVKHDRIAAKHERQRTKGWPSDKSPI